METGRDIERAYETEYTIEDPLLDEPFVVRKPLRPDGIKAWWRKELGGEAKVLLLMDAFKMHCTVWQACVRAGISEDKYKYFCAIHPEFSNVKLRCEAALGITAKMGMVVDVSHPSGYKARQWFLERNEPERYGQKPSPPELPNGASRVETLTQQSFIDGEGKVIISHKSADIIETNEST